MRDLERPRIIVHPRNIGNPDYSPTVTLIASDEHRTFYARRRFGATGYVMMRLPRGVSYDEVHWRDARFCFYSTEEIMERLRLSQPRRLVFPEPDIETVRSEWEGARGVEGPDGEMCIAKVEPV